MFFELEQFENRHLGFGQAKYYKAYLPKFAFGFFDLCMIVIDLLVSMEKHFHFLIFSHILPIDVSMFKNILHLNQLLRQYHRGISGDTDI